MLINTIGGLWTGFGSAGPRSFYINGEGGAFFDFSAPAALFQDAAGATALTTPGQTIGLAGDKSRTRAPVTAYAGIQASAGLRPTYGRAPKSRRNRLVNTETFVGAVNMAATVVTDGTLLVPTSGFSDRRTHSAYTTKEFGLSVAISVSARADGARYMHLGRAGGGAWFDLLTGTVLFVTAGATATIGATGGDGLRRASVVFAAETLANGTATQARIYVSVNAPTSSLSTSGGGNNSVDGIVVNYLQLEQAAASTPYQKVATDFDMTEAGYPAYGYARLDGADDKLTVSLPAPITGDLMLFGRNGSWIEAGVTLPSGAFDLGPTGTVLTPGVLRALGDLVGVVIIVRTTTATERALALRYFAARGAANWLVAGAEMLPNGGFADGTGWTNGSTGTGTAAISGGQATLTGVDASNRGILLLTTNVTGITIGQPYMIQWQILSGTANSQVTVSSGGTVLDRFGATVAETRRAVFIAGATAIGFGFNVYGAGAVVFDNFSIKPLTPGA